ncbi:MAG: exodeoxyribonuclease V subunit beta [Candidatus Competibacterales bacterium]
MNAHNNSVAPNALDVFSAPLTGASLVEASAGTGKTYAIAGLYLRFIAEVGLRVDEVLVVTYTKAATAELKERLQGRLLQVRGALRQGESDDPFAAALLAACPDHSLALRRVNNALLAFDEAAIYTIHGFCQRVLAECAFESGTPFDAEIKPEADAVLLEIIEDFWRRRLHQVRPLLASHIIAHQLNPEVMLKVVQPLVAKPYLKVAAGAELEALGDAETVFEAAFAQAGELWRAEREAIVALLQSKALKGNVYNQGVLAWCEKMDDYLNQEGIPDFKLPDKFDNFTVAKLRQATLKKATTPDHPFFHACETLKTAVERLDDYCRRFVQWLQVELLHYASVELPRRKRRQQIQSYDDLLLNLHGALVNAQGGEDLATRLRQRYRAALIDEFQDTDPVQYEIFKAVYGDSSCPWFMVGDPKQAIYSFRGADIFAYLRARQDVAAEYTLDTNWRSDPRLIRAVNALFSRHPQPFLLAEIPFYPVRAAERPHPRLVTDDDPAPFHWWYLEAGGKDKPRPKGDANTLVARATAGRIARLLAAGLKGEAHFDFGDRREPLHGGHVAVLVRSHHQARLVRDALLDVGVASVLQSRDSVFATTEADELQRILVAIAAPRDEERLRAALLTDVFGFTATRLEAAMNRERDWEALLASFDDYHRLWREQGFIRMFRTLLQDRDGYRRLLDFRDGERRLTNLLHLAELLQEATLKRRLGVEGLLQWLADQRHTPTVDEDSRQLRLESDAKRVEIVTIHKSKGLEYPIVFCPFLWDSKVDTARDGAIQYHDPDDAYQVVVDLGSAERETVLPLARRETLAEELRLAYVALTRAKYRCYGVWGKINGCEQSGLGWLIHRPPVVGFQDDLLDAQGEYLKALDDEAMGRDLAALATATEGAIAVAELPRETEPVAVVDESAAALKARNFQGSVVTSWRFASFSALQDRRGVTVADYDAEDEPGAEAGAVATPGSEVATLWGDAGGPLLAFPRGAVAGRCLHGVLDGLDLTTAEGLEARVAGALARHGLDPSWAVAVEEALRWTLDAPLDPAVCLRMAGERGLRELAFTYHFRQASVAEVRAIAAETGGAIWERRLRQADFDLLAGFMRGFVDLIFEAQGRFYLVDYKSNWLGGQPEDYSPKALERAMESGGYHLQYLIYTIALHRLLRWRLRGYDYRTHVAGVRYLFLRGIHPDRPGFGVYADCPPAALIEALDDYLGT